MNPNGAIRVLFSCTGVGTFDRGIETFFREAFDGLRGIPEIDVRLLKGAGPRRPDEHPVWTLHRTRMFAKILGRIAGRNGYVVEQWSSFLPIVRQIRRFQPHVVFYSDANLGFLLYWFRNWIGVPYRLLFSNGGPSHPPFVRTDFVHQVAPLFYDEAIAAGEAPEKHFLVPYGIAVPTSPPAICETRKREIRTKLGLPLDRQIVLSVGWISRRHKRMDYVIEEIASLATEPRPFLQLLGATDDDSQEVVQLGLRLLGAESFSARSVNYENVADYYHAADVFVLGSLVEGFGRVFLEALMHGLPVVAHRHPVMEYVLGDAGIFVDLSKTGGLSACLADLLARPASPEAALARWRCVRDRFSWPVLQPHYRDMFLSCARSDVPT